MYDIWPIKNHHAKWSFTWNQSQPIILSTLDYWLTSNSLSDSVCDVGVIPSIKTDHSAIIIELKDVDDSVKGHVLWKLNCSLLRDDSYVEEINKFLPGYNKVEYRSF